VVAAAKEVTQEEIGLFYDDHLDEFLLPETVRMRQMVVKDLSLARNLLWKLRKGMAFSDLAGEQARGLEDEEPGSLETYRRGELPEALEIVAFSAQIGRPAGPVETPYGFHLIRVEEKVPAHLPALDEVREEIVNRLRREREEHEYALWIDKQIRNSDIQVHDSLKGAMRSR
jgi:parvulin-like peptidyl-prolyl isomerase